jgi:hypothetical protein
LKGNAFSSYQIMPNRNELLTHWARLMKTVEDLSDFRQLVSQANDLIADHGADIPASQRKTLSGLLRDAELKLDELHQIVVYHTERSSLSGKIKASRFAWSRRESEVTALRVRFASMKLSLAALLGSMTM